MMKNMDCFVDVKSMSCSFMMCNLVGEGSQAEILQATGTLRSGNAACGESIRGWNFYE